MNPTSLKSLLFLLISLIVSFTAMASTADEKNKVRIWEETITLPTYFTEEAEECPVFFQNNSYQGASRVSYPYPEQDILSMQKGTKEYTGLFIENEYIKLCVLPEFGGRLFYATDKTNGYELFYRQHVIKPMLIGMLGAWISGGIEFCVFHHHRASTHMPVEYAIEENKDGSATIWIGEFEPRHRMRWNIGISLHPGRSWVTVDGTMINATENVNSILYWANVATHVNEDYQVIFPRGTEYAVYHAKNSFAHWPVTAETYNGKDYYQQGIDASWYRNHPTQGSFFAHDIKVGNLAGYDWGKHAGTMHVGNHHIVKGAKLWQWGRNSTFDREALTDNDGPYAELMVGAYSDNQPDYSWIKPYEVKKFRQTWYPLRETEGMKYGNLDAVVNLEVREGGKIFIAANTTRQYENVNLVLTHAGEIFYEQKIDIGPAAPYSREINAPVNAREEDLKLVMLNKDGKEIIVYQPEVVPYNPELPPPVIPPGPPEEYTNNEELYFAGERIRQFHNARLDPSVYFLEALKRDPLDVRCNTAMGIISQEKGDYIAAKSYYRKAISRITANYTRPRNCEPLYHLGVILKQEGSFTAAIDTLYRAAWDYAFRSAAYFQLAQIHTHQGEIDLALTAVEESLAVNGQNISALCLKTSLLRHRGDTEEAMHTAHEILHLDRLNYYVHRELVMLKSESSNARCEERMQDLLRDYPENYLELASYYMGNGLFEEAREVLEAAVDHENERLNAYPTIHYYLGYLHHLKGDQEEAAAHFAFGSRQSIRYCFPFRLESINVYKTALEYHTEDARACYYLGNLLYDRQPEAAIAWWERAVKSDPELAMAHRNLGWGYNQTLDDMQQAMNAYRTAIVKDPAQPRFYAEYDELMETAGASIEERLEVLTSNHDQVNRLQSALIREILVLVHAGELDRAIELLDGRDYYRQEGVNIIHDIHVQAHLLKGKQLMESGDPAAAVESIRRADSYPKNQMIDRPPQYEMNARIYYYNAQALEQDGDRKAARKYYEMAVAEDADLEFLYYRAIALEKIGQRLESAELLVDMVSLGKAQLDTEEAVDFFAKFGDDLSDAQRKGKAYHILGMAHMGMGEYDQARDYFNQSLTADVNQLWSRIYLGELENAR